MTRAELKQRARNQLGNNIFGNNWLFAILALLINGALSGLINIIPGLGSVAALIISGPIAFGMAYLFLKQARDGQAMKMEDIFIGFKADFGGTLLLWLLITVFTILWSLLFIIPGIVKSYSYSMAFYIKVDHPEYDWRQCIQESQRMMNGHKWELFVLQLSFLGWIILGALCFGVGSLWVSAYMLAAEAQFYENLKNEAVEA